MNLWRTNKALAFFIALDVLVLVAVLFVVQRNHVDPSEDTGSGYQATGVGPTSSSNKKLHGPIYLTGSPGGKLVRATRGVCGKRDREVPQVWVANKALAPLKKVNVRGLFEVLGVSIKGNSISIVGTDSGCQPAGFSSTDGGRSWKKGKFDPNAWSLSPDPDSFNVTGPVPKKSVKLGCPVSGLQSLPDGNAIATCSATGGALLTKNQSQPDNFIGQNVGATLPDGKGGYFMLSSTGNCASQLQRSGTSSKIKNLACLKPDGAALGLTKSGKYLIAHAGLTLMYGNGNGKAFRPYPN